jgi:hypothetical protein
MEAIVPILRFVLVRIETNIEAESRNLTRGEPKKLDTILGRLEPWKL